MIERARLVLGKSKLADARARPGTEPPDVVRDLHQADVASVVSAPLMKTIASCAASAANRFGAVTNGRPVRVGDLRGAALREPVGGVESGPDRRAPDRELVQTRERGVDPCDVRVELRARMPENS